ncbi:hypothetical protein [Actinoplanes sp. NPDC049265]|uniref:hypothetical protein n=1 Tax=Actinoplanes sp. NPDC049265 TaxID=3363902 RepID=UPI003712E7B5
MFVAVLAGSSLAGVALSSPASAAAPTCYSSRHNNSNPPYATGYCTGTTAYYLVQAQCEENSGNIYNVNGGWARNGQTSRANCSENSSVIWAQTTVDD